MARAPKVENVPANRRLQKEFGRLLQRVRREGPRGRVKQLELAHALGVSRTTVSNIERGRHRVFLDQAYMAARTLTVPVADLLPSPATVFGEPTVLVSTDTSVAPSDAQAAADVARIVIARATAAGRKVPATKQRRQRRLK